MIVQLAQRDEIVLDAAGFTRVQAVVNAARLDYVHGFSFYVGNNYGVSKTQLTVAFDHGKKVSPNREGDSHEAFSWRSGPVREIDEARRIMDDWGLDWRNVPCIDSAVDWNPLQSEIPRCDDWWKTYVEHARNVGFWGGYYGATNYGRRLTAFDWWPEDFAVWTWGGSGEIPGCHMKQFVGYPSGNDYSSIGVAVDESRVRGGLWMATSFASAPPPPPPPPTPTKDDMIFNPFVITPSGAIWYTPDAVIRRHIIDYLDLRSTMAQAGVVTGDEAWGQNALSDDQLRAKCAPLGAEEHVRYFGVDVDTLVEQVQGLVPHVHDEGVTGPARAA